MANEQNLKPFTSDQNREEAAKNGKKGGIASGIAKRKKNASRAYLKEILAMRPVISTAMAKRIMEIGGDPDDGSYTMEKLTMVAMIQKAQKGDVGAVKYYHEMLGEDPKMVLEKEKLKAQKAAIAAIRGSDGFMDAMMGTAREVFDDGGDTPDTIEDSE